MNAYRVSPFVSFLLLLLSAFSVLIYSVLNLLPSSVSAPCLIYYAALKQNVLTTCLGVYVPVCMNVCRCAYVYVFFVDFFLSPYVSSLINGQNNNTPKLVERLPRKKVHSTEWR